MHIWFSAVDCQDHVSEVKVKTVKAGLRYIGRQPLGGSISLKFLLETRLQSEFFDTLDDLLGFRVQKLWCKLVKIFD